MIAAKEKSLEKEREALRKEEEKRRGNPKLTKEQRQVLMDAFQKRQTAIRERENQLTEVYRALRKKVKERGDRWFEPTAGSLEAMRDLKLVAATETCSAEPVSEKILLSPSSVMLALELPFTSIASLLLLILISLMVTFAAALSDVDIAIVFPVSTELSRCVITGASSGTADPPPCVTVCPELSAFTVTLPSSRYQLAA